MTVGRGQSEPVVDPPGRTEPIVDFDSDLSFIAPTGQEAVTDSVGRIAVTEEPGRTPGVRSPAGSVGSVREPAGRVAVTDPNPRYTARED